MTPIDSSSDLVTCLRGGRIIDPASGRDEIGDLYFSAGRILPGPPSAQPESVPVETIEATGLLVVPGLIDLHVHLREPGQSHKETIGTGTRAAAAGGFTTVVAMPNTSPAADSPSTIKWMQERSRETAVIKVLFTGAITKGLAGEELAPIGSMARTGIVAVTDDGHCVQNHEVMRRALEYTRMFGLPVFDHCQDYSLAGDGVMHEGEWSLRLGLPGWPRAAEELIVARNILLAELCDTPIHCQHLSSGGSVRLLREARARGVKISGEVCPHHVWFTDSCLRDFDSSFKMNPPLREERDIQELLGGLADGTIEILASDHAPHAAYEKEVEIDHAPFGILGLETELAAFATLLVHREKVMDWSQLIAAYTTAPAKLLRLESGTLAPGAAADITVIDPDHEWTYARETSASLSRNTPFHEAEFRGRAVRTIVDGRTVWAC